MKGLLLLPIALFVAACCMPVLELSKDHQIMFGGWALVIGPVAILVGVIAWCANPMWLISVLLIRFRQPMWPLLPGLLAIYFAANVFTDIGRELPGDEGGVTKTSIVRLLPGYYLWLASMISLPVVAVIRKLRKTTQAPPSLPGTPIGPGAYPGPM